MDIEKLIENLLTMGILKNCTGSIKEAEIAFQVKQQAASMDTPASPDL